MTVSSHRRDRKGPRRPPAPLDETRLKDMALAYVARFATSAGRLEAYCRRKLRERGHVGADDGVPAPDVSALVARFVEQGFVDDAGFAQARTGSLLRRGYGKRRIGETLRGDGISEEIRAATGPGEADVREAAVAYARRRRLGPFAREGAAAHDRASYEKQLAAFLRAGHDMGHARHILGCSAVEAVDEWVAEAADEKDFMP